jgi:hypothetical protein
MRALPVAAVCLVVLAGCGSGPKVTESRTVGAFDRLEVDGISDVDVTTGPRTTLRVTAPKKSIGDLRTEVRGGTLTITGPQHNGSGTKVVLTAPSLRGVQIQGSGDVRLHGLAGPSLTLGIHGSGDVKADGHVDSLDADIAGSGDIQLGDLAAKRARVSVAGSGDSDLNVSDTLDITVAGSGDVTYRGHPTVRSNVAGSGDVRQSD